MNILADENIDAEIVAFLRSDGHDVSWMAQRAPGTPDDQILNSARAENRVIITFDRDFGELVYHHHQHAPGIIFLRLQPPSPAGLLADFQHVWPRISLVAPSNFVVATRNKIRVRPIATTTT